MSNREEWSLDELTTTLQDTAKTDKDNPIAIDGNTGVGKSTIGLKMCIKGCPWFDMQKDILYSRDEIMEWVHSAKPGSWGLADEAINALFKRDFATRNQKFLLKIIDMCRDRNLTLIFCIPNFWALDKHILEGRLRLRIHVAKTGLAFMWKPSGNPFDTDRWNRKYNQEVCRNWDFYPNAKRTKGFIGYLKFGDLAEKYKEVYLKVKADKKRIIKEREDKEENESAIQKKRAIEFAETRLICLMDEVGILTMGDHKRLAESLGLKESTLSMRLKNFRERFGSASNSLQSVQDNIVYKYMDNTDDLTENDEGKEQTAI